jgi:hypothetical protein
MHKHHHCYCDHLNLRYCKKCGVPYCLDCGYEWRTYYDYPYRYYTYPTTYTITTTEGSTWSGSTYTPAGQLGGCSHDFS